MKTNILDTGATPGEIPDNLTFTSGIEHEIHSNGKDCWHRDFTCITKKGVIVTGRTTYFRGDLTILCSKPSEGMEFYSGHACNLSWPGNMKCISSGELTKTGILNILGLSEKAGMVHIAMHFHYEKLKELYLEAKLTLLLKGEGPDDDDKNKKHVAELEKQMNQYVGLRHFWGFELMDAIGVCLNDET